MTYNPGPDPRESGWGAPPGQDPTRPGAPGQAYPAQGQTHPGQTYPGQANPPFGGQHASPGGGYPPSGGGYPPSGGQYQPGGQYPPPSGQYPGGPYPPSGQGYPSGPQAPAAYGGGYPPPGAAMMPVPPGMYVDPESGMLIPQGTQMAGVGRRIGAYFLAFLLWIVTLGIGYLIWGAITWAGGQTPTQQVLGMRCWKPQTQANATWGTMALREIVGRIVDGIALDGLVSFIMMLASRDRRTLYDHISGVIVLYDPDKVLQPR